MISALILTYNEETHLRKLENKPLESFGNEDFSKKESNKDFSLD